MVSKIKAQSAQKISSHITAKANSVEAKGKQENKLISNDLPMENRTSQPIAKVENRQNVDERNCLQSSPEDEEERMVYFAIERKWRLVGRGIFRK